MIMFYILLFTLGLGFLLIKFFKRCTRGSDFGKIILFVSVILLIIWSFCALIQYSHRAVNTETYNELMLYKEAVEVSTNEQLRFDYYNKITKWNNRYNRSKNFAENPWLNWWLISDMNLPEVSYIEFVLRR